jgi:hypothetical protein
MKRSERSSRWSIVLVLGASIGIYGCYTVISHPRMAPQQQVAEDGTVLNADQCVSCHTQGDLWSFHHGSLYPRSDGYYYSRFDPVFFGSRWYGDHDYYGRWVSYYYSPWWYYPSSHRGPWNPEIPALGRGGLRDSVSRVDPRSAFVALPGYGPGTMPTFPSVGLPVNTGSGGAASSARVARDSTNVERGNSASGRPIRVEARDVPAAQLPVSQQPVQQPAATKAAEAQQQEEDSAKSPQEQSRGRGDSRRGSSGSQAR